MQFVVDANILFAALIKESTTLEIFIHSMDQFVTPEFVLEEFKEHRKELLEKTKKSEEDLDALLKYLESRITIVPKEEYDEMFGMAETIAPDSEDAPYLALALKMNLPIWSNDKKLKEQEKVRIYNTKEILSRF